MSSSKLTLTHNPKRKRDEGVDEVIRKVKDCKKGNLTPMSQKLCDDLLKRAEKAQDSGDADDGLLSSSFAYFEAKQKQVEEAKRGRESAECEMASVQESLKSAEAKLKSAEAEIKEANKKEQDAKRALQDYELIFEFGDWFGKVLARMKAAEKDVQDEDLITLREEYKLKDEAAKTEAEDKARAEAEAEGKDYTGSGYTSIKPQSLATKYSGWGAIRGRLTTETQKKIDGERAAIDNWRKSGKEEASAPGTPFLDRIDRMCEKAGVTRLQCLHWVKEYSERNEVAHRGPPTFEDHKKTVEKDGKVVKVEFDTNHPEDAIDWLSIKATIDERKSSIERRFTDGQLDEERRDCYIALIDAWWEQLSSESDESGNPIPTAYAKAKLKNLAKQGAGKPDPTEDYLRVYKKAKWDDIPEKTD